MIPLKLNKETPMALFRFVPPGILFWHDLLHLVGSFRCRVPLHNNKARPAPHLRQALCTTVCMHVCDSLCINLGIVNRRNAGVWILRAPRPGAKRGWGPQKRINKPCSRSSYLNIWGRRKFSRQPLLPIWWDLLHLKGNTKIYSDCNITFFFI